MFNANTRTNFDKLIANLSQRKRPLKLCSIRALASFIDSSKARIALIKCTYDADDEYRYTAIEALDNFVGDDVEDAVIERIKDKSELVRITAIEFVGEHRCYRALPYLKEALRDEKALVRCYAAEAVGILGGNQSLVPLLEEGLKNEKRNIARLGFYLGLYQLNQLDYLGSILNLLKAKSYKVRCATANSLVNLATEENYDLIIEKLKAALAKETTVAARSSMQNAIIILTEQFNT